MEIGDAAKLIMGEIEKRSKKGEVILSFGAMSNQTWQKYSFMIESYEPAFFVWDVVEMYRKVIFVVLASVFGLGSLKQLASATVFAILHLAACVWIKPHRVGDGVTWWSLRCNPHNHDHTLF